MCHFVTAVLPVAADVSRLDAIARRHHRQLQALANSSIEAQLLPNERYFLTTLEHCDCGTALGAHSRTKTTGTGGHNSELERLRARGWSEAKLTKWLEQKQRVSARNARVRSSQEAPDTSHWRRLIEEILNSGLTRYVGLLLHMYSGPLSGRIQLAGRQVVLVEDLTEELLAGVDEDVLYEFRSSG